MAKKKRRRRKPKTIAILPTIGVAIPIVGAVQEGRSYGGDLPEQLKNILNALSIKFMGYNAVDNQWETHRIAEGWIPVIVGALGHKAMSMLGVNRTMATLPPPLNKLRL